jgi:hypothetical protein
MRINYFSSSCFVAVHHLGDPEVFLPLAAMVAAFLAPS